MDDIKVCNGPTCQGKASKPIYDKLRKSFGASATISMCDCQGACDQANNILYNGTMIRGLNEHSVERFIKDPDAAVKQARNADSERTKKLEMIIDDPFYFTPEDKE